MLHARWWRTMNSFRTTSVPVSYTHLALASRGRLVTSAPSARACISMTDNNIVPRYKAVLTPDPHGEHLMIERRGRMGILIGTGAFIPVSYTHLDVYKRQLFDGAQARMRLARVDDLRARAFDRINILTRRGGDARHELDEVERGALAD